MANDIVNPFQLFRDDAGRPLAAGQLRVLVNRTSTLGTAFSDSALTVPQTVDPYVLDAYGRVRGDLRWSGERSVEVYDRQEQLVRTLDDVVTIVDTSSFTINVASVAAMVALSTLELGDVVETQSYNADQGEGGARYLIVAAATGTDDGYTFHDLTGAAPLQAQLLDIEENNNFYVAGAIGDGLSDDSVPVQVVLDVGGDVDCSNGIFLVDGLTISQDTRISGDGTLRHVGFASADLLTLSGADVSIAIDGIVIDGNNSTQAAENTLTSLRSSVTGTAGNGAFVSITNVAFLNGNQYDVRAVGSDDGTDALFNFGACRFIAGLEGTVTPYLTACISLEDGVSAIVEDCVFDLTTTPADPGGRGGIVTANSAFTNPGFLSIADCTFNRMGLSVAAASLIAPIEAIEITELIATANRITTPLGGGITFGAEVDSVIVQGNLIDALTGTDLRGAIEALQTTQAGPGDNWLIEGNEILSPTSFGIDLDGLSAGIDASQVAIVGNVIDSPGAAAILVENIDTLDIRDNFINMDTLAATDAIQNEAAGLAGVVTIKGNTIINVALIAIELANLNSGAIVIVDGNAIESVVDAIDLTGGQATAIVTNNALANVTGKLVTIAETTNATIDGNSYVGAAPSSFATRGANVTTLVTGENFWDQYDASITDLTIAANTVEGTSHYHRVLGPGTVNTITFPADIQGFVLVVQSSGGSVTFADGAGNLNLGAARVLDNAADTLTLVWNGSGWDEIAFANNA